MMGCGNYPQTPEFMKRLGAEIRLVVRSLRHHPSIYLWAGDNECDMNYQIQVNFKDPNRNILTRKMISELLLNEDFTRPYLPSSPYIDETCLKAGLDKSTENHLWGDRIYYKAPFYAEAKTIFASEIGYHGCPSPETVRRFLSPEKVWPPENNKEWLLHASSPDPVESEPFGYRIKLMKTQITVLFGDIPDDLAQFSVASQISQAEAMQFFIQRFRINKWKQTGIIWWNICDGWPQFSDAVVDYYFIKKLAYHYIKRCQQPVCIMADEIRDGSHRLVGVNDTGEDVCVTYQAVSMDTEQVVAEGQITIPADGTITLDCMVSGGKQDMILISWEGDASGCNTYLLGEPVYDLDRYMEWASKAGTLNLEGFDASDLSSFVALRENKAR